MRDQGIEPQHRPEPQDRPRPRPGRGAVPSAGGPRGERRSVPLRGAQALLLDIASRLVLAPTVSRELLDGIVSDLGRRIGAEIHFHHEVEEGARQLRLVCAGGIDEETRRRCATLAWGEPPCGLVAEGRRPLLLEDLPASRDPRAEVLVAAGLRSYLGVPLLAGGRLYGTLAFASRRRSRMPSRAPDLAARAADLVAGAIARETLAAELRASEARFRAVFDNVTVGLGQVPLGGGGSTEVNDTLSRMLGYTREELLALRWTDLTHPDDIPAEVALVERMEAGEIESFTVEKRYLHREGHLVWGRLTLSLVRDEAGRPEFKIGLVEDISERKRAEAALRDAAERAQQAARTDGLTGLPNRTVFNELIARPARAGERGVLFLDVNGFKRLNDSLGHAVGDQFIRELGCRLAGLAGPGCALSRIGGDEFVFVVTGPGAGPRTRELAQAVRAASGQPIRLPGLQLPVRLALGYAVQADDALTGEALVRQADLAMYEAKRARRPEPVAFTALIEKGAQEAEAIERGLRRALDREGEIAVAYQPIVGPDGRLSHAEALARWTSPELGPVPPDRFIAVAERSGLMLELGRRLLRLVCDDLCRWPALRASVNVSPIQLMAPDFPAFVLEEIRRRGLHPGRIELELTESVLVEDAERASERIGELRRAGFAVALDDFGRGFSSLGTLQSMEFDRLKIDRAFVTGFTRVPERIALLGALIVMAHAMKLEVTCEGVEEEAEMRMLGAFGCDRAQGFWIGRPEPLPAFAARWLGGS